VSSEIMLIKYADAEYPHPTWRGVEKTLANANLRSKIAKARDDVNHAGGDPDHFLTWTWGRRKPILIDWLKLFGIEASLAEGIQEYSQIHMFKIANIEIGLNGTPSFSPIIGEDKIYNVVRNAIDNENQGGRMAVETAASMKYHPGESVYYATPIHLDEPCGKGLHASSYGTAVKFHGPGSALVSGNALIRCWAYAKDIANPYPGNYELKGPKAVCRQLKIPYDCLVAVQWPYENVRDPSSMCHSLSAVFSHDIFWKDYGMGQEARRPIGKVWNVAYERSLSRVRKSVVDFTKDTLFEH